MSPNLWTSQARRRCVHWAAVEVALLVAPVPAGAADAAAPTLTAAQQVWLQQHQPRFAPERDYGPFVFAEPDGRVEGLSIDVLRLLQQRMGLTLQWLPPAPLHQQLDAVRRGEADLLSSLRPTPERAAYLSFTRPYASVPAVLVQRRDAPALALEALAGRPVAVGKGYAVEAVMRQRYPQVRWEAVSDDVAALQGVQDGRFDAAVADAASVVFVQRRNGLVGLQARQRLGFEYALSFGVRRDWPELLAILDAGILALTPAEREAVSARWLGQPQDDAAPPKAPYATRLALGLLGLGAVVALLMAWRRRALR